MRAESLTRKEFNDKLATVAELAVGDACTGSNPRSINPADGETSDLLLL